MIKVISFDIGGTLIQPSRYVDNITIIQLLSMLSTENLEVVKLAYKDHFITKQVPLEEFCKKTNINKQNLLDTMNRYYKSITPGELYSDVLFVLEQLKRRDIIMITLSNCSYMNPFHLDSYGLQSWFSQEIYSFNVGYAKPNVLMFQYVQQLLEVEPNEILHVGNSYISDYLGAKKARWNSLFLVRDNNRYQTSKADLVIKNLNDLFNYI